MTTAPEAPHFALPVKTRWLWVARGATFLWLPVIIAYLVDRVLQPQGFVVSPITLAGILLELYFNAPLVVLVITLVGILGGLFSKAPRRALPWAFGVGSVTFVAASVLAIGAGAAAPRSWWVLALLGLFLVTQAVLAASALKSFYALGGEKGGSGRLAEGIVGPLILILIAILITPAFVHRPSVEVSCITSLMKINTAEITYAETYKVGFSPTLAALGGGPAGSQPTPSAAGLIDAELAGGRKSGYVFTYTPGPPDKTGHIATYTVVARPLKYGKISRTSFFTDESGGIHKTDENRPATAKDPHVS